MGYPTDATTWPKATSASVVQLFDLLFTLIDTRSETIGEDLADKVFTDNGMFMATSGAFQGREAIRNCRKGVWNTVISRQHQVKRAYVNDSDGTELDLILIGAVEVGSADGNKHTHEFVVRTVVVDVGSDSPRVQIYQVLIPTPKSHQVILG